MIYIEGDYRKPLRPIRPRRDKTPGGNRHDQGRENKTPSGIFVMHTIRFLLAACLVFAFSSLSAAQTDATSPLTYIQAEVEKVFQVLRQYPVDGDAETMRQRREAIRKIIDESFDADEMARRALGKYWREQPPEKLEEFTKLFYWRLYNFYILRIETYSDEKVMYGEEKIVRDLAAVSTRISSKRYPEFDIEYRLKRFGDGWKIYDVVIEGVSLISNYRSQFTGFLSKKSFDELLKALREKAPDHALKQQ